jgi:hypothetical protein
MSENRLQDCGELRPLEGRGFESGERYERFPTQAEPLFSKTYRAA